MKPFFKKNLFAPFVIGLGFAALFVFQNCSRDVGFNSRPSAERPDNDASGTPGIIVGGNSDVVIKFNEVPKDTVPDPTKPTQVVDYEVTTPNGTIVDIECTLNGRPIDCDPVDQIPLPNGPAGSTNTFVITVTPSNGPPVTETITWTVRNIITLTKDLNVNVVGDKVDIVINVDNSGSMEYEQKSMAGRISTLMDKFKDLDYFISVTTTSPIGNSVIWKPSLNYVDGKFVPLASNVHCIKKGVQSLTQAQTMLRNSVVRDLYLRDENGEEMINPNTGNPYPEGNGWERGIFTTYRAFERYKVAGSPESGCLRPNVPKHVILISDENETLTDGANPPRNLPDVNKSNGSNLRSFVASTFGADTVFKFHSIIVNPYSTEGAQCLASHGARIGTDYGALSRATGGAIGSVCATDYAGQLGQIGELISNSSLSYTLNCVTVLKDGKKGTVVNLANNQPVNVAYTFNGDKVEFAKLLNSGTYRVTYHCYQ